MTITLTGLHRYPVKSCRGERLVAAEVRPWGLDGDRRWMLVDSAGRAITAREIGPMVLVHPEITATGIRLSAPGALPLEVAVPDPAHQVPVRVFRSEFTAAPAGAAADAWLSDLLGTEARLVHLDDPMRRGVDLTFGREDDRVSLADGYPLLLTSEESLAALNDEVTRQSATPREMLPVDRFRPNVVVRGAAAWAEDDWRVLRIGDTTFRVVKGCARCVLTTVDPATGEKEKEPLASLARIRRIDGKAWFGVNLVPDAGAGAIGIGDEVEVLESVPAGAGPPRAETVARCGGVRS